MYACVKAQEVEGDLRTLCVEYGRQFSDLKNAAERAILRLRSLHENSGSDPFAATSNVRAIEGVQFKLFKHFLFVYYSIWLLFGTKIDREIYGGFDKIVYFQESKKVINLGPCRIFFALSPPAISKKITQVKKSPPKKW